MSGKMGKGSKRDYCKGLRCPMNNQEVQAGDPGWWWKG